MQKVVENIKELYERGEPTGECIVDQLVALLRMKPRLQDVRMMAALLECDVRDLRGAVHLLTGWSLRELVTQWRYLQAKELLAEHRYSLQEVAERCGWKSVYVLNKVFRRMEHTSASYYEHEYNSKPIRQLKKQLKNAQKCKNNC